MARRRQTDSSFEPTPVQAMILQAVEKEVDWDHISTLVEMASKAQAFDASVKWDSEGNAMVAAIGAARRGSYNRHVPPALIEQILKLDPGNLERPNNAGYTAVDLYLDNAAERSSYALDNLGWWIKNAPKQAFLNWAPRSNYGEVEKSDPTGNHLVDMVLSHEMSDDRRNQTNTALPVLFELGISPNLRGRKGEVAFSGMHNAIQWEAFLAAGGNGSLIMGGEKDEENDDHKKTLWNYLVDRRRGEMEQVVRQWAADHASGDISAKDIADYWKLLQDKSKYSVGPGDIIGYLRKHEDFLTLRDEQGRNCLTYGIQMHASSWKTLDQKRFAGMLKDVDNEGNSLWYYALLNGKRCTGETASFLKKNNVPCEVGDDGRGLIARLLLAPAPHFSSWERIAVGQETGKKIAGAIKGEALWAAPDKDGPELFKKIFDYATSSNRSDNAEALLQMANAHVHEIQNIHLLGAVAVLNLKSRNGDIEIARECIDRGGVFPLPQKELEAFLETISDAPLLASLEATRQRATLKKEANQVEQTRSSPRL